MVVECQNCGERGNLKTGEGIGPFIINIKFEADINYSKGEAVLTIKCTECGNEVEY